MSKFDREGIELLGFSGFNEAFNAFGYALKARPASLKNYRDEFDPLFPNTRKGWHKRKLRQYCKAIYDRFGHLELPEFSSLVATALSPDPETDLGLTPESDEDSENWTFANRLITGAAAEEYFQTVFPTIELFGDYKLKDSTRTGCGYDFKLEPRFEAPFVAVEVKGLREMKGSILLTSKEYRVAERLRDRYYVFVARNFVDKPSHSLYRDPVGGTLSLIRRETTVVRVDWAASLSD